LRTLFFCGYSHPQSSNLQESCLITLFSQDKLGRSADDDCGKFLRREKVKGIGMSILYEFDQELHDKTLYQLNHSNLAQAKERENSGGDSGGIGGGAAEDCEDL